MMLVNTAPSFRYKVLINGRINDNQEDNIVVTGLTPSLNNQHSSSLYELHHAFLRFTFNKTFIMVQIRIIFAVMALNAVAVMSRSQLPHQHRCPEASPWRTLASTSSSFAPGSSRSRLSQEPRSGCRTRAAPLRQSPELVSRRRHHRHGRKNRSQRHSRLTKVHPRDIELEQRDLDESLELVSRRRHRPDRKNRSQRHSRKAELQGRAVQVATISASAPASTETGAAGAAASTPTTPKT
ncbi:hypothetical protein C8J56DRAFT_1044911 [Mycena floridula]|nr:hypothetical protein C8J56DRAFT_1044911 [Mycena floridula]